MRLEDLLGEIPSLCKDQHGCRYLQKKLEEGVPEHRDMIFRETFGHFPELMIGVFTHFLFFSFAHIHVTSQTLSATICVRNSLSIRRTSNEISSANLLRKTWSIFH